MNKIQRQGNINDPLTYIFKWSVSFIGEKKQHNKLLWYRDQIQIYRKSKKILNDFILYK